MRKTAFLAAALAAATVMATLPSGAQAQRYGRVEIRFARGATCWVYQGRAFRFTGRFFEGQTLRIRARGQTYNSNGRRNWITYDDRSISIGPQGADDTTDVESGGTYDVPETGRYEVTLWPHAIQGAPGTVQICTRG